MIIRRVQRILSTRYYHTSTSSSSSNISDDQLGLLKSLGYRDLQRLAKLHNINARQKGTVLIQELSEILPATLLSKRTTKWMPPQEDETDPDPVNMNTQVYATRQDQAAAKDHDHDSAAADWLAPGDVDPTNKRIMKQSTHHYSPRQAALSTSFPTMGEDDPLPGAATSTSTTSTASTTSTSSSFTTSKTDITGALDPDAEWHDVIRASTLPGGLERTRDFTQPMQIVEGVPLSSDHIIDILAENNARNIQQFDQVRADAEHYIIATGLSLRHVRSLRDALVFAAKKTKVPGLSSSSIASGGKKSPLMHWEVINLRETMVHVLTEQGRILYDLETLWTKGLTEKDLEELLRE